MATRFDQVTIPRPARPREGRGREADRAVARTSAERLAAVHLPPELEEPGERALPVGALGGATSMWLSMVAFLCYLGLPALLSVFGIGGSLLWSTWLSLPAFAMPAFVTVVAVSVARPRVSLRASASDPIFSAVAGGLGTWAVIHNTSPFLVPFAQMSLPHLAAFLALNVLEMTLLGVMFASFTRRPLVALGLGAGFQLLMLGSLLSLISLLLAL